MGAMVAAAILQGIGVALQATGEYSEGEQEKATYDYNAKLRDYNASVLENEALAEEQTGKYEARLAKRRAIANVSEQRANIGASGVSLTSPSTVGLLREQADQGEMDWKAVIRRSQIRANMLRSGIQIERSAAVLERMYGKAAKKKALYRAGTTLLTGAGKIISFGGGGGGGGAAAGKASASFGSSLGSGGGSAARGR